MIKHIPNGDVKIGSINLLDFISVIIGYAKALTVIKTTKFTDDPHPVMLAWCDNMSAIHWVTRTSLKSKEGCAMCFRVIFSVTSSIFRAWVLMQNGFPWQIKTLQKRYLGSGTPTMMLTILTLLMLTVNSSSGLFSNYRPARDLCQQRTDFMSRVPSVLSELSKSTADK